MSQSHDYALKIVHYELKEAQPKLCIVHYALKEAQPKLCIVHYNLKSSSFLGLGG